MEKDIRDQTDKIAEGLKWEAEQAVRERRVTAMEGKDEKESLEAKAKRTKLESLKKNFFSLINKSRSMEAGVGQFVPDENKAQIAEEIMGQATKLAEQYKAAGGDLSDLGLDANAKEKAKDEMPEMPSAKEHKGKTIRDTQTKKRYKSDGKEWIEIKK